MSSLADYNNNPGNIRPPKGVTYDGQIGVDDNGFAVFQDKEAGQKALVNEIQHKLDKGLNTPESFINVYTPASAENPEESRDNYKLHIANHLGLNSTTDSFPENSAEKLARAITEFEGGSWKANEAKKEAEKTAPNATSTPLSQEPWSVTHSGFGDLNNLQQSLITGGAGALMGGAAGAAKQPVLNALAYFMTPRDQGQSANRVEPSMESTAPANATSSPWQPPTQQQTAKPKSQRTAVEEQIEGKLGETGSSGRANENTHNLTSAQMKARTDAAKRTAVALNLDPNAPLAEAPELASTKTGIAAPRQVISQYNEDQINAQRTQADRQAMAAQLEADRRTKVISEVGRQAQAMFARAAELEKAGQSGVANALRQKAMEIYKNGLPIPEFMKSLPGRMASIGGGFGAAVPTALDQYQHGDTSGALKTLGIGTGVGAALTAVPQQVLKPLNTLGQGYEAIKRGISGDYLGAGLSAAGAVAPYAVKATNPAGVATAVAAPLANATLDYYKAHPELREQPSENAQFLGP